MGGRSLFLVLACTKLTPWVIGAECVDLVLVLLEPMPKGQQWLTRPLFIMGCAMLSTFLLAMIVLRGSVNSGFTMSPGLSEAIKRTFSMLAIGTGVIGYFSFQSSWRNLPLVVLTILGIFSFFARFWR
jgi:hypothetical protein